MSDDLEQAFRRREMDILHLCATRAEILASKNARRHLMEGFYRRLGILETNRINIREIADPNRTKNLSPYECGDLNLHLNSYYFQMRGSLDNLAWIVHYELALLGTGDESDLPTRRHCNIFGRNFLKALDKQRPSLKDALSDKRQWERDFKELRDPVAHRIPLYAPPGVINSENDVERFKELDREGTAAALGGIFEEYRDKRSLTGGQVSSSFYLLWPIWTRGTEHSPTGKP